MTAGPTEPEIRAIVDRAAIVDLHTRYGRALDTKDWELMRTVFTEDAFGDFWVGGQHRGIESILHACRSIMENLEHTQHVFANHEIDIDGDRAVTRVDLLAGHFLRTDGGDSNCTVHGLGNTGIFSAGAAALAASA